MDVCLQEQNTVNSVFSFGEFSVSLLICMRKPIMKSSQREAKDIEKQANSC